MCKMNSKQIPPTSTATSKVYTHWIHCNICYARYNKKEHRFYLLACHHVTCEPCIVELEVPHNGPHIYKCPVCQKITRACEINNTMPNNLKELFHPTPYMDVPNSFQIMMFQSRHRQRFREYLDRQQSCLLENRKQIQRAKVETQKTYQEYEAVKAERKHLEKRVKMIRQQRRDIDDNRSNKSMSSSSSGRSSSTGPTTNGGIENFSNLLPKISFVL